MVLSGICIPSPIRSFTYLLIICVGPGSGLEKMHKQQVSCKETELGERPEWQEVGASGLGRVCVSATAA